MNTQSLCLAQINPTVGDISGNVKIIIEAIEEAKANKHSLIIFPASAVPGFPVNDLIYNEAFLQANRQAISEIAAHCHGISAVVGFINGTEDSAYNSAAVISEGKAQIVKGPHASTLDWITPAEKNYLCEMALNFDLFDIEGLDGKLAVCLEDNFTAFFEFNEAVKDQRQGSDVLIACLNTYRYTPELPARRRQAMQQTARRHNAYLAACSLAGAQGCHVLCGGSLICSPQGEILAQAPTFEAATLCLAENSQDEEPQQYAAIAEKYRAIRRGLQDYLAKSGFSDVVIGISGGVDSALVAALAVDALGPQHVHGIYLPSRYSSDISTNEAAKLCKNLGIELKQMPIEGPLAAFTELFKESFAGLKSDVTEENLQARIRANILMGFSNKFGWLMLCTGNKSESACGYSTLYGDAAGAIAPIGDLYKTEVWEMCRYINRSKEIIPDLIITRPPSAELRPDQKDSDSLPDYKILDEILRLYVEDCQSAQSIIAQGYEASTVHKVINLTERSEYKRRQEPFVIVVSDNPFGLRRAMPLNNKFRG